MSVTTGSLVQPTVLKKDTSTATPTYARFTAEPFELGFAKVLGNSLRRVLLGSIEGAAISTVRIDGVYHEYQSVEGVVEDMTQVVLNIKNVLLRTDTREPARLIIDVRKQGKITAGDITLPPGVHVVNPGQVICTVDRDRRLFIEMDVKVGRGYIPSDINKDPEQAIGVIAVDSLCAPVTHVRYAAETFENEAGVTVERLEIDVTTDGRITPDEAIKQAAVIYRHHLDVFDGGSHEERKPEDEEIDRDREEMRRILAICVNDLELTVRAVSCLNNANITTVGELVQRSEADLLRYRNFGKKSLTELKEALTALHPSLQFGMKHDPGLLTTPASR